VAVGVVVAAGVAVAANAVADTVAVVAAEVIEVAAEIVNDAPVRRGSWADPRARLRPEGSQQSRVAVRNANLP
jgi:hypothetical protein